MSDRLSPGQNLPIGQSIISGNGEYRLAMQHDGNLVLYDKTGKALWASNTNNVAIQTCAMQSDGNLVLYRYDGHAQWASNTHGKPGAYLVMQNDGNAVIYYDEKPKAVWATGTNQ